MVVVGRQVETQIHVSLQEGVKTENDHINLKVAGQDGSVVQFKIKRHTPLSKLMKAYCERQVWGCRGLCVCLCLCRLTGLPRARQVSGAVGISAVGSHGFHPSFSVSVETLPWHSFLQTDLISSVQSLSRLCPTLCDPMNRSTPGLPVYHQLPGLTQTHVH